MQITAHSSYYSAACENCGNTLTVSYRDLRACFEGSVPNEDFLETCVLCVCELPQPESARLSLCPSGTEA